MASSTVRPGPEDRPQEHDVAPPLLDSAAMLAYDPATEVDWETRWTRTSTARARSACTLYGHGRTGTR
ncbi:hypothetical protein [Streptomyces flavovirens]|uniref:hypothetical protein n=1 Tax=Streptomyces flavovirens TaxID=52258 RepID=UPI0031EC3976